MFKGFDAYTVRARIFPALIAGFPTLALLLVIVPWNWFGLPHVIAATVGFVLLFAFADVARRSGRRVEAKLGSRATPELWRHDDDRIDLASKDRYKVFVASKLKLKVPTKDDELSDPLASSQFYLSAGNWLRDQTRDTKKFNILFDELITYGFRRNLLGLKHVSLAMNSVVFAIAVSAIVFRLPYLDAIPYIFDKAVAVVVGVIFHSLYMAFAVDKESVWEASRAYGKQLILSCETLMRNSRSTASSPQKSQAVKPGS